MAMLCTKKYIPRLKLLGDVATLSHFQYLHPQLAWETNSRPYTFCQVTHLTQFTNDQFFGDQKKFVKQVSNVIKYLQMFSNVRMEFS